MAHKHKATKPRGELMRNAEETLQIERYWQLADRPMPRIPPKDYHYVKELVHLQFELIKLQEWVRLHGLRICVLFEGRDAAGKGGVIKRITQTSTHGFAGLSRSAHRPRRSGANGISSVT